MEYLVGVDIGGTFTDFVAYNNRTNEVQVWKNATTPHEPILGVLRGLERLGDAKAIDHLRLGTTIATNAILERKGGNVAYVTTKGFRDIPFIQRGNRKSHYDMSWVKTKPLVKRRNCLEVDERVDREGVKVKELQDAEIRQRAREIRERGDIEAIAVNCLFSYLAPGNERRIRDIFTEELPDVPVSVSSDVLPKWKEYERASTTIADAYLKPVVRRHFDVMRAKFDELGVNGRVVVIKSNGGETTLAGAMNAPVNLTVSGPTGGVVAAKALARAIGAAHLVTFDMGGTSTDCSTIVDGAENFTTNFEIEWGIPIQVPMIDIRSIGAGGGSIAWIDKGGMLRVGPQSAGADPGPACYGQGGKAPTITDANVALGRINPDFFLGGEMKLDKEAALSAVASVAKPLGMSIPEAAVAMIQIANNNMIGALRTVLLERGLDPRDFTLAAFGGAGPLHASDLIHMAGIPQAIIPNYPGQFSAYGFIMTDARVDKQRTLHQTSTKFDQERSTAVLQELVDQAVGELRSQGYTDDIALYRTADLRYLGQNYELELPYAAAAFDAAGISELWESFHKQHNERFGFSIDGEVIEMVNLSVTAVAASRKPDIKTLKPGAGDPRPRSRRPVHFDAEVLDVPVYHRDDLCDGHRMSGPAIIEESASVTVLRPGQSLSVDAQGNLLIKS